MGNTMKNMRSTEALLTLKKENQAKRIKEVLQINAN